MLMTNRILRLDVQDTSLIPAEAEVRVTVVPEYQDAGTEVRGRLIGPRCRFASTVEVAYHLRRLPMKSDSTSLTYRVVIPEANLWEPVSPHLYSGPIELWQDGVRCETMQVCHGLRDVAIGASGLRLNGRPLRLRGREVQSLSEEEALALRQEGYNLLLTPVGEDSRHIWELADQVGFFVLGKVGEGCDAALTAGLARHSSCVGWLLAGDTTPARLATAPLLGSVVGAARSADVNFLAVPSGETPPEESDQPMLLMGGQADETRDGGSLVLGAVEQWG
jgi:hypothetical protein